MSPAPLRQELNRSGLATPVRRIDPRLRDALIRDARRADALPMLQLTLEWLYREFTTAEGTRLGLEEYEWLSGVRRVIHQVVRKGA